MFPKIVELLPLKLSIWLFLKIRICQNLISRKIRVVENCVNQTVLDNTQCGNFMIFLSLRFYVKLDFGIYWLSIPAILTHLEALNFELF